MGDWSSGEVASSILASPLLFFAYKHASKRHNVSIAAFRIQISGHAFLSHAVLTFDFYSIGRGFDYFFNFMAEILTTILPYGLLI